MAIIQLSITACKHAKLHQGCGILDFTYYTPNCPFILKIEANLAEMTIFFALSSFQEMQEVLPVFCKGQGLVQFEWKYLKVI